MPATNQLVMKGIGYMPGDHRGHLIGDRFYGPAKNENLVPMHSTLNLSTFKQFENAAAKDFLRLKPNGTKGKAALLYMRVIPKYPGSDRYDPATYRPRQVTAEAEVVSLEKSGGKANKVINTIPQAVYSNPEAAVKKSAPVNLNTATRAKMETLPGVGPKLAASILEARKNLKKQGSKFNFYSDITAVPGINDAKIRQLRSDPNRPVRLRD